MSFMTTPDQEYILSVLGATKAMRRAQAYRLLGKLDGRKTERYADRCIEQLRHMRKIRLNGDMIALPLLHDAPPDEGMLAATDIMLDLTDIRVCAVSASVPPYKLCFLAEQKNGMGNYAVAIARPGAEALLTASLQNSDHAGRTVIFLLSGISQAEGIKTSLPHFFALPDGGKHKYLSG